MTNDWRAVLDDERYVVPPVVDGDRGVAWLRANVVRFSEGDDHRRRRAIVERLLHAIDPTQLDPDGDHVAALAVAVGIDRASSEAAAVDVRDVAASYQPHLAVTTEADTAVARLVGRLGGVWDEATANRIGLLVQGCDATANMIAGLDPPVPATRRIAPDGTEMLVDLAGMPFGAGRHECPGQAQALALVAPRRGPM